jgi:excisionase family DNA binding protein
MATKEFISIKEASIILGVSKGTLRNWDESGKLRAHRHPLNNYRVYKTADIDKLIEMIGSSITVIRKKKSEVRKLSITHLEETPE